MTKPFIVIECNCKTSHVYVLDHNLSTNPESDYPPMIVSSLECPICGKLINIKIELWDA